MYTHYIFWTDKASDVFLEGSTIQLLKNHRVIFKNMLMAPSCVIHEWRSKYNFQESRRVAVLPNLKSGKMYRFKLNATVIPENTLHINIIYYNQFNEKIDCMISKTNIFQITVPENTYSYVIQLINAGCHTVDFSNIVLNLVDESIVSQPFYQWINQDIHSTTAHVLFIEQNLYYPEITSNELVGLSNVLLIPCTMDNRMDILSTHMHVLIKSRLADLAEQGMRIETIRFIGYGSLTNFMSLAHSCFFANATCFITNLLLSEEQYIELFGKQLSIFKDVSRVLSVKNKNTTVLPVGNGRIEMLRLQPFLSLRAILLEMQLITKN